jgi:hypothetical protein
MAFILQKMKFIKYNEMNLFGVEEEYMVERN